MRGGVTASHLAHLERPLALKPAEVNPRSEMDEMENLTKCIVRASGRK